MTTSQLAAIASTKSRKGGAANTAWSDADVSKAIASLERSGKYAHSEGYPPYIGANKKPDYNAYASGFYLTQAVCRKLLNDPKFSGKGAFEIVRTKSGDGFKFAIHA